MVSPARQLAHHALVRVFTDGAYAERILDVEFTRRGLQPDDRALAHELVFGVLRQFKHLDFVLNASMRKPLRKQPLVVQQALRLGVYQLLHTRVPDHAAVNESVALASQRHKHVRSWSNAVLRTIQRNHAANTVPQVDTSILSQPEQLAVTYSHPEWLVAELLERLGAQDTEQWLAANQQRPPLMLRHRPYARDREAFVEALQQAGFNACPVAGVEFAVQVSGGTQVGALPGYTNGEFVVQDPAAQRIGECLPLEPGDHIVDLCAAPGGKAGHIADRLGNSGRVLAVDTHPARCERLRANMQRLQLEHVTPACIDGRNADAVRKALVEAAMPQQVDGVILDAPCTGLGTTRRNPETRLTAAQDATRLAQLQRQLLDTAAQLVRPGGYVLYAVCTVTAIEGEELIGDWLCEHANFVLQAPGGTDMSIDGRGCARTWIHKHHCDSFFMALLRCQDHP